MRRHHSAELGIPSSSRQARSEELKQLIELVKKYNEISEKQKILNMFQSRQKKLEQQKLDDVKKIFYLQKINELARDSKDSAIINWRNQAGKVGLKNHLQLHDIQLDVSPTFQSMQFASAVRRLGIIGPLPNTSVEDFYKAINNRDALLKKSVSREHIKQYIEQNQIIIAGYDQNKKVKDAMTQPVKKTTTKKVRHTLAIPSPDPTVLTQSSEFKKLVELVEKYNSIYIRTNNKEKNLKMLFYLQKINDVCKYSSDSAVIAWRNHFGVNGLERHLQLYGIHRDASPLVQSVEFSNAVRKFAPPPKLFAPQTDIYTAMQERDVLFAGYDFEVIPARAPDEKPIPDDKILVGKIYLAGDGSYIVRDPQGKVIREKFKETDLDLGPFKTLDANINNKDFRLKILEVTTRAGHALFSDDVTSKHIENYVRYNQAIAAHYDKDPKLQEKVKSNLNLLALSYGKVDTIQGFVQQEFSDYLAKSLGKGTNNKNFTFKLGEAQNIKRPKQAIEIIVPIKNIIRVEDRASTGDDQLLQTYPVSRYFSDDAVTVMVPFLQTFGGLTPFKLKPMSELPDDPDKVEKGEIFLSEEGTCILRDASGGSVRKINLMSSGMDLRNLQQQLANETLNEKLKESVLAVTSKAGLTRVAYQPVVISEFASQGDLDGFARKLKSKSTDEKTTEAIDFISQLSDFCNKLIESGHYHPDIKLSNFLTDGTRLIVADRKTFTNKAKILAIDTATTPEYAAPEYRACIVDRRLDTTKAQEVSIDMPSYMSYQVGIALKEFMFKSNVTDVPKEKFEELLLKWESVSKYVNPQPPSDKIKNMSILIQELTREIPAERLTLLNFQKLFNDQTLSLAPDKFMAKLAQYSPVTSLSSDEAIKLIKNAIENNSEKDFIKLKEMDNNQLESLLQDPRMDFKFLFKDKENKDGPPQHVAAYQRVEKYFADVEAALAKNSIPEMDQITRIYYLLGRTAEYEITSLQGVDDRRRALIERIAAIERENNAEVALGGRIEHSSRVGRGLAEAFLENFRVEEDVDPEAEYSSVMPSGLGSSYNIADVNLNVASGAVTPAAPQKSEAEIQAAKAALSEPAKTKITSLFHVGSITESIVRSSPENWLRDNLSDTLNKNDLIIEDTEKTYGERLERIRESLALIESFIQVAPSKDRVLLELAEELRAKEKLYLDLKYQEYQDNPSSEETDVAIPSNVTILVDWHIKKIAEVMETVKSITTSQPSDIDEIKNDTQALTDHKKHILSSTAFLRNYYLKVPASDQDKEKIYSAITNMADAVKSIDESIKSLNTKPDEVSESRRKYG